MILRDRKEYCQNCNGITKIVRKSNPSMVSMQTAIAMLVSLCLLLIVKLVILRVI